MAIRLRDIDPVVFLHSIAVGHANDPGQGIWLDIRNDANEHKTIAAFTNPLAMDSGRQTKIELGTSRDVGKSALFTYIFDGTNSGNQELSFSHRGDDRVTKGLHIHKGGNVGVGVEGATAKLQVDGEVMVNDRVIGESLQLILDTEKHDNNAGKIHFSLGGTAKMKLTEDGLGIGTDPTSTEKLKVIGK